jgi:hypothetical protein
MLEEGIGHLRVLTTSNRKPPLRHSGAITKVLSARRSGCYWLLGVVVGDGVAAGAGVLLKHSIRMFQSLPSRITDQ